MSEETVPKFLYEKGFIGPLFAASSAVRAQMALALESLGLPAWGPGRIGLLSKLLDGPLSQTDIARFLHISSPSAMELVRRLERDGFVTRRRDAGDRRRVLIALTPQARRQVVAMRHRLTADMAKCEAELSRQGFTQADFDRSKALLRAFTEIARAEVAALTQRTHDVDHSQATGA